ncbi:MAG: hypothetical protein R3C19_25225 [Planctomycetaceae bacterium]
MKISGSVRVAAAACLAATLLCSIADAQPPGGGRGGRGGFGRGFRAPQLDRAALLANDEVRADLKVDEDQKATIEAALAAFREEGGGRGGRGGGGGGNRPDFQNMTDEERAEFFATMQKEREERSKKQDEVLGALLKPEQTTRIDQIALQANLAMAVVATLKGDDLKAKLALTEDQLGKLDAVEESANAKRMEMFAGLRGGGGPPSEEAMAEMRKKGEELNQATQKEAMAVLTDAQNKQLDEMKGAAFSGDLNSLRPQFGRGFGGGRGGRGGGGGGGGRRGGQNRPPAE